MIIITLVALFYSVSGAKESKKNQILGQRIDFVERNVLNILRHGDFPQLYDSSYPKIKDCGCYYSPTKITFGTRIGLQCQRKFSDEKPLYDEENCGIICNDPHGLDVVFFCPHGWDSDCNRGCFPPDEFDSVTDRVDFWELTLTSLMMYGHEYVAMAQEYLDQCGCEGKVRPIRYGTQIGFDCVLGKGKKVSKPICSAGSICKDERGQQIVSFCPAGHKASCNGCVKIVNENGGNPNDLKVRLNWMVNVVAGYTKESLELLGWEPNLNRILECACSGSVRPITYGASLGYYCHVNDPRAISEHCGATVICKDDHGKDLLHFCPEGFVPDCAEGCGLPFGKDEL